jgi:hypothetical protein
MRIIAHVLHIWKLLSRFKSVSKYEHFKFLHLPQIILYFFEEKTTTVSAVTAVADEEA